MMSWVRAGAIAIVGLAAIGQDVRTREISNWTNGLAVAVGLAVGAWEGGWPGLGRSAGGLLIGFFVFFGAYLLNWRGGGDVKLMAGFGSLLGTERIWHAVFLSMVLGGVFALLYLVWRKIRPGDTNAMPAAPSIVVAAWLACLVDV